MENNIQFRIHKVPVLPDKLIKGHIYFEHSTGCIHVATSETDKETFGDKNTGGNFTIQKITEGLDNNIKEAYALVGEDGIEKGDRIYIYKAESLSNVNSDGVIIANKIPVIGGPLSDLLINSGITEINPDTNLQDLLTSLFCQENWPKSEDVKRIEGYITGNSTANNCTMIIKNGTNTLSSEALVYPGTQLTVNCSQNTLSSPTYTNSKISGLTWGYSWENDNIKNSDKTFVEKTWTITPNNSEYKINIIVNGSLTSYQDTSLLNNKTATFNVIKGLNNCKAESYGIATYSCTIDEIPDCYWVSNLGKTNKNKYTNKILAKNVEVSCGNLTSPQSTATFKIYGTLPAFNNVSSGSLNSDTIVEMPLSSSKIFTISTVPSEERSNNLFMFDFPSDASISSMEIVPLANQYNIYSNIDLTNNTITSLATHDHGKWSKTISITNVPSEVDTGKRFMIEYPACVTIDTVSALNDATGKFEAYSQYKTENIVRGSDSYTRLTMTHQKESGPAQYSFTFSNPQKKNAVLNTDYTIQSGISKIVNNVEYTYNRLVSKTKSGFTSRTITLNKSLNT